MLLFLPAAVGDLARFPNRLEPIAVRGLAPLDRHELDPRRDKTHLVDHLGLAKLDRELLGEHSRRQPE